MESDWMYMMKRVGFSTKTVPNDIMEDSNLKTG